MLIDSVFAKNEIIGAAMQSLAVRNDVINNNIVNADTPDYKKKAVMFESVLQDAIDEYRETGKLDLTGFRPSIREIHSNFNYRIDGNNVDIETEMIDLYTNSVKYDVLAGSVGYRSIQIVLDAAK